MLSRQAEQMEFIDHTMRFVGSLLASDRVAFYQVENGRRMLEFQIRNVEQEFHDAYLRSMHAYDPLHVTRLLQAGRSNKIFWLHDQERDCAAAVVERYRAFLGAFHISDVTEMLFGFHGEVVAGISVLWNRPISADTSLDAIYAAHAYIEFHLQKLLMAAGRCPPVDLGSRYGLTRREVEVSGLVCCGRTNAEIAECLGLGLATVKTHLINIYRKLGIENRASLVALASGVQ